MTLVLLLNFFLNCTFTMCSEAICLQQQMPQVSPAFFFKAASLVQLCIKVGIITLMYTYYFYVYLSKYHTSEFQSMGKDMIISCQTGLMRTADMLDSKYPSLRIYQNPMGLLCFKHNHFLPLPRLQMYVPQHRVFLITAEACTLLK